MSDSVNSSPAVSPESVVAKLRQDRNDLTSRMVQMHIGWTGCLSFAIMYVAIFGYLYAVTKTTPEYEVLTCIGILIGGVIAAFLTKTVGNWYVEAFFGVLIRNIDRQLAGAGVERLQETLEDDFFNKLVKINFKYIDQYYLQTQSQADKSFTLTAVVSVVGFLLLVAGVVLMYLTPDKVAPAYVSAAAGVISEFVASVFFYLYNRTIIKMGEYHQKLVLTQNIGLALKITEELPPDQKAAAQRALVDRLSDNINHYLSLNQRAMPSTKVPDTE